MKRSFSILLILLLTTAIHAQVNNALHYSTFFSTNASRYLPSKLGEDFHNTHLSIGHMHAYTGNTTLNYNSLSRWWDANLSQEEFDNAIDELRGSNLVSFGFDFQPLMFSYRVGSRENEKFSFSLGISERLIGNFEYGKNLFKLTRGNRQFAGETISLDPLSFHLLHTREYALGFALFTMGTQNILTVKPAGRIKFLHSYGAIHTDHLTATMFTHPDGRYIDFEMDYRINSASMEMGDGMSGFSSFAGSGWAFDLGFTATIYRRVSLVTALLDVGKVSFSDNVRNYHNQGKVRFDGVEFYLQDPEGEEEQLEYFRELFQPQTDSEPFDMPLGTRLILQGEYTFGDTIVTRRGYQIPRSTVFLTYVQGFENQLQATLRPYYAVGYSHNFGGFLNLGAHISNGGYNKTAIGAFMDARARFFRIGIGSNNIMGLIDRRSATGADATFNLNFSF